MNKKAYTETGRKIRAIIGEPPECPDEKRKWKVKYVAEFKKLYRPPKPKSETELTIIEMIGTHPPKGQKEKIKQWRKDYMKAYYVLNKDKAKAYQRDYSQQYKKKRSGCSGTKWERKTALIAERIVVKTVYTKSDLQNLPPTKLCKVVDNILSRNNRMEMA